MSTAWRVKNLFLVLYRIERYVFTDTVYVIPPEISAFWQIIVVIL